MSRKFAFSKNLNPYFNLALEDFLFRNMQGEEEILLIWKDQPSIICGRFQNPLIECDLEYLKNNNIMLVRRQSGGGTVYHDEGNINISFISPKSKYNKEQNLDWIIQSLSPLGLSIRRNSRNDLVIGENDYKISGSAFKENRDYCFHHCTLLVDSDLEVLNKSLIRKITKIESKGVDSKRSIVANLKEFSSEISTSTIVKTLLSTWQGEQIQFDEKKVLNSEFFKKIQSYEWVVIDNPPYKIEIEGIIVEVKKGRIVNCEPQIEELTNMALGDLGRHSFEGPAKSIANYFRFLLNNLV